METENHEIKIDLRKEVLLWLAIAGPVVFGIVMWEQLPEQMPVHWNIEGTPDNFFPKFWGITALFLINAFTYAVLLIMPHLDPRKFNYQFFSGPYFIIRAGTAVFLGALHMALIITATGDGQFPMPSFIVPGVFLLLSLLGNYMTTLRSNYFIGIRTPWTLENQIVWKQTHRMAGKLWFWAGLAGMLASFFIAKDKAIFLLLAITLIISVIPAVYSFVLFRRLQSQ